MRAVKDSLVALLVSGKKDAHDQNVLVRRPQLGLATPPCNERVEARKGIVRSEDEMYDYTMTPYVSEAVTHEDRV